MLSWNGYCASASSTSIFQSRLCKKRPRVFNWEMNLWSEISIVVSFFFEHTPPLLWFLGLDVGWLCSAFFLLCRLLLSFCLHKQHHRIPFFSFVAVVLCCVVCNSNHNSLFSFAISVYLLLEIWHLDLLLTR